MALTTQQLADALRLDAADAKIAGQLQRIQPPAEAAVLKFAPHAPEAIRDEATIRLAGYLYDAPTVPAPGIALTTAPLRASGAAGLLAPYRRHRLGLAGAPERAQPGLVPGAPTIDEDAVNRLIIAALAPYATTQALNAAIAGIMPSSGGGGLTTAQAASLARLMVFESGMKRAVILGTARASVTQAVSGASASIPGNPILPANRFDREILVSVGTFQGRFYIKDLENLNGVGTIGAQLNGSNAIEFTDSVAAAKYFISFHTTDRALLFASDTTDTYQITLSDYDIDLEDFARRSNSNVKIEADKLPVEALVDSFTELRETPASFTGQAGKHVAVNAGESAVEFVSAPTGGSGATAFTGLSDTPSALGTAGQHVAVDSAGTALEFVAAPAGAGGGLSQSQVDARIATYARAAPTGRMAEAQLPQKVDDLADLFHEGMWGFLTGAKASVPLLTRHTAGSGIIVYDLPETDVTPGSGVTKYIYIALLPALADGVGKGNYRLRLYDDGYEAIYPDTVWTRLTGRISTAPRLAGWRVDIPSYPAEVNYTVEEYTPATLNLQAAAIPFTALTDTPAALGTAGQRLAVNAGATALEFIDPPAPPPAQRGLRILHDANLSGLALTNLNSDVRHSALTLLAPVFDLDTAGNGNGEFHAELTLTVNPRSANTIGFTSNALGSEASRTVTGLAFSTTLAAAAAYVSTSSPGGVILAQASLYNGTTVAGTVILRLGRNAANQVGIFLEYDGAGAAASGNCSIAARLELSFTPSDAPAASAGGGGLSPTYDLIFGGRTTNIAIANPAVWVRNPTGWAAIWVKLQGLKRYDSLYVINNQGIDIPATLYLSYDSGTVNQVYGTAIFNDGFANVWFQVRFDPVGYRIDYAKTSAFNNFNFALASGNFRGFAIEKWR